MERVFGDSDLLPMWVADMDFEAPECVKEAIVKYAADGLYGYYRVPDAYYDAFIAWEKNYHNYDVKREWIQYVPGVVPALYWLVQVLTSVGDHVAVMPPVYPPFYSAVKDNNRKLAKCPLLNENGKYTMDLERFEALMSEKQVKLFILCSPHNPAGRVWSEQELRAVLEICRRYGVYVVADEIHQDLIMSGHEQISAAVVGDYGDMLVTLTSATKTFNIAGCQNAFLVIQDEAIRKRLEKITKTIHAEEGNAFGYIAVQAAYEGGREWLDDLLQQVEVNYRVLKTELAAHLPQAVISPLEGTYLAWVDMRAYLAPGEIKAVVQDSAGLAVNFGNLFGGGDYASYIRINLATRQESVEAAAKRLIDAIK